MLMLLAFSITSYAQQQGMENQTVINGNLSDNELSRFRTEYINELNRQRSFPLIFRLQSKTNFSQAENDAAMRNAFALQLRNVLPNYVPFAIAPPYSSFAGVGAENPWSGSTPYRYNGNIMIYPNDPTRGYVRMAVGSCASMLGGYTNSAFFNQWNHFSMPFGVYQSPFTIRAW